MPTGKYYTEAFRRLIYQEHVTYGHTPEFILTHCLARDYPEHHISINYLTRICASLHNPQFAENYIPGPKVYAKTGRKRKLSTSTIWYGFICHRIFEGSVTDDDFLLFLDYLYSHIA